MALWLMPYNLWAKNSELIRETEVDTEIILALVAKNFSLTKSVTMSIAETFGNIRSETSIALLFGKS